MPIEEVWVVFICYKDGSWNYGVSAHGILGKNKEIVVHPFVTVCREITFFHTKNNVYKWANNPQLRDPSLLSDYP